VICYCDNLVCKHYLNYLCSIWTGGKHSWSLAMSESHLN